MNHNKKHMIPEYSAKRIIRQTLFCLDDYWQEYQYAVQNSVIIKWITIGVSIFLLSEHQWDLLIPAVLLMMIAVIDMQRYSIPDILLYGMAWSCMAADVLIQGAIMHCTLWQIILYWVQRAGQGFLIGVPLLLLVLLMDKLLQKESMGGGDIKLMFIIGFCMDALSAYMVLFLACMIGLIWQIVQQWKKGSYLLPFGPSIAIAAGMMLVYDTVFVGKIFCIL